MIIDLPKLERLAREATPGPWRRGTSTGDDKSSVFHDDGFVAECYWKADAEYVAAASPDAVLELITEHRELRQRPRQFAEEHLNEMHARPGMWASSKEAFVLQILLLVEIATGCDAVDLHRLLREFFPGTNAVPNEPFDDAWARQIVEIARKELEELS